PPPRAARLPYATLFRSALRRGRGLPGQFVRLPLGVADGTRLPQRVNNDVAVFARRVPQRLPQPGRRLGRGAPQGVYQRQRELLLDRKSTRLNSSHVAIS